MLDDLDPPRSIGQKTWVRVAVWLIILAMLLPVVAILIVRLLYGN